MKVGALDGGGARFDLHKMISWFLRLFQRPKKVEGNAHAPLPPLPAVGDPVYIPTQLYVSHGADDRRGGLTQVAKVEPDKTGKDGWVTTVFDTGEKTRWSYLAPMQAALKEEFGDEPPRETPDYRPEFNRFD